MKGKRFTEEQIIAVLREAEAGAKTKELCRKYGISEPTFYNWKAKYAGMTVSDARRLKELEAENSKLKKLLAESELDKAALKDHISFNGRLRDECLNEHWFTSLAHARAVIEEWRREYNEERPKKALGGMTPAAYATQ